jgi:hypothetical protein
MKFEPKRPGATTRLGVFTKPIQEETGSGTQVPRAAMFTGRFVIGKVESGRGDIPLVSTGLEPRDRLGAIGTRLGIWRNRYRVEPGLYAVGKPGSASPVLVSANYKLSFDCLRKELGGIDAWILVLDSKGVNVWCAAGKGSFGNAELAKRIGMTRLGLVVSHRTLILPQLAATGISAPAFKRESGWAIRYGPVLARDLPAYLAAGLVKTDSMRRMDFPFLERMKLVPLEILHALPRMGLLLAAWILAAFAGRLIAGIPKGAWPEVLLEAAFAGGRAWLAVMGAILVGTGLVPALLPWIPFRSFVLKGLFMGLIYAIAIITLSRDAILASLGLVLALPAISAWLSLNFTGSTTYTSLAGVLVEVKAARIPLIAAAAIGLSIRTVNLMGLYF